MVNGKICNSTHTLLRPGDIVEPAPGALALFERFLRRRLANNTFVFKKESPPTPPKQLAPPKSPLIRANFDGLLADGGAVGSTYVRFALLNASPPAAALPRMLAPRPITAVP